MLSRFGGIGVCLAGHVDDQLGELLRPIASVVVVMLTLPLMVEMAGLSLPLVCCDSAGGTQIGARAMLVEAAWAASKAPGPLRAFFLRIRARRGHQVAAVAVARKLAVLCWHLLIKDADYQWARPALVANKLRAMELKAGQPVKKGNKRGSAYAYNIKALRDREIELARHAEQAYERFVSQWQPRRAKRRTGAANEERH